MRIAIIGLGGVGGYISAYLAKSEHDLVCVARGRHLKVIQKEGLKIIEDTKSFNVDLDVREFKNLDGHFDIVLFCVKSYDLQNSYAYIKNFINEHSILLSFSNGVNNGDILRKLSQSIVLDGCMYILSHIQDSGVIRKEGKVFAAVFGGDNKSTNILKNIFEDAGLRVKTPSDIKTAIYKKYIFISAFASLTTYYDLSIAQVYEKHFKEAKQLLSEIANVAFKQGIDISSEVDKSLDIAKSLPFEASTSMHLDFKNNKKMEIVSLCFYIIKEAHKYNIGSPVMKKIYDKLIELSD
ncbi:MAG: 2-dehydropantoate 2-reductase [Sulfurimonas sp.]|nr:MAG: 2-dehydropantoate 2-reductase [Sulfurimonas sp.]